jgi:CO/xanthine dehydrogenase Mo-binding subunit
VYTNHPFATAYRGFGHIEISFAVERAMDLLADELRMGPVELRLLNAVVPGDSTPSRQILDPDTGDPPGCIRKVSERLEWKEGARREHNGGKVRAKGIACFWKAPAIPPNTSSAAVITFSDDGSVNLITGIVEIGSGATRGWCM